MVGFGGKLTFGQMSAFFPPQLVASEIKKIFLSSNMACLLAFEWQAAGLLHFSNMLTILSKNSLLFNKTHWFYLEQTSRTAFIVPEGTTLDPKVGFIFTTSAPGRCQLLLFRFFELFLCIHSRYIACHICMLVGTRSSGWQMWLHSLDESGAGVWSRCCWKNPARCLQVQEINGPKRLDAWRWRLGTS